MGKILQPAEVKLVSGLLLRKEEAQGEGGLLPRVLAAMQSHYGPIETAGEPWDFTYTDYYENELGSAVLRMFVSFERPAYAGDLAAIKVNTNAIEEEFLRQGRRSVNIDPGYVTLSKLVLATTKEGSYRVYMDKGIFGQATLYYEKGSFHPWPWTYPDYRDERTIGFFNAARRNLRQQTRRQVA